MMRSLGINREGELMGQLVNPGLPEKMAVKMECACMCVCVCVCVMPVYMFTNKLFVISSV